jgi:cell division protein FtsN
VAAKRGKSQARRNSGGNSGSIPGWAWMVLGILLTVVVVIVAPKYLKSNGDGFFRPQPNPDAQPVPLAEDEDAVAPEGNTTSPKADTDKGDGKHGKSGGPEYDFYTLLPGKEVPLSDAEIAATERAEARRLAAQQAAAQSTSQTTTPAAGQNPLPQPVDSGANATPAQTQPPKQVATATPSSSTAVSSASNTATPATTATANTPDDNTRYLLQAGAFQASGQAEEMKAKIALLGLGARVEAAQIGGKTVYRVRMGPYGTASDLADAKRKLSAGGLPAMAIRVK